MAPKTPPNPPETPAPEPDRTIRPAISGSKALYDAARGAGAALGLDLSKYVDGALRARLEAEGRPVPPALPPPRRGPKPKAEKPEKR